MRRTKGSFCLFGCGVGRLREMLSVCIGTTVLGVLAGCGPSTPSTGVGTSPGTPSTVTTVTPAATTTPASATSEVKPAQRAERPTFDEQAAFEILKKQCSFGPRPLGTDAHEQCKDYLLAQMKQYADETFTQTFRYRGLTVTNVIGIFYPAGSTAPSKHPVLLLTHWDSRPIADGPFSTTIAKGVTYRYGARGWNQTHPIMAANDGASGPGVLLELARMFKKKKPDVGVVMLLDDGEDYGDFQANGGLGEGVELGSRYFAQHYREDKRLGVPDYGILLDMVGGKNMVLPLEKVSMRYAPGTLTKVFATAKKLGYGSIFRDDLQFEVNDDHVALNQVGMRVIDLIPYFGTTDTQGVPSYTYWHTLEDTVDKCSPNALKAVGETVAEVIYNETPVP